MRVKKIFIKNFRNISEQVLELSDGINILKGQNAHGKTNFIEALYLCATGRSFRTNNYHEIIKFDSINSEVKILYNNNQDNQKILVSLSKENKKNIEVNDVKINKLGDLFGKFLVVVFSPEDLQLVKSNPSVRRKFMDTELCQINKIYYNYLRKYYKVLRQRNNTLKKIRDNILSHDILNIWDEQLINFGSQIIKTRDDFIKKIDLIASDIYSRLTNSTEILKISYKPSVFDSEEFKIKLKKRRDYDIFNGATSVGIHKDDLEFEINNISAKIFGSQGQKKSIVLILKLAELELIKNITGAQPVLLLDDVLSELDISRQTFLFDMIKNLQVFLTCTEIKSLLQEKIINNNLNCNLICVSNGKFFYEEN